MIILDRFGIWADLQARAPQELTPGQIEGFVPALRPRVLPNS
ncbi:hypothetical protein [Deinococcus taeanensis]|nr:hypothetical protein [Deinococcus taeanensis]